MIGFKPVDFENDPKKFEEMKKLYPNRKRRQPKVKSSSNDSDDEGDYSSDDEEEEEGQLKLPPDVVRNIEGLIPEQFYLVCYLREKTEQEIQNEKEVRVYSNNF